MSGDAVDEASARAARQLIEAKAAVDAAFGEGHAAAHPELVAAMVQAAAIHAAILNGRQATTEIAGTLLQLKPRLFG
ncbi:hypothetical protein [Roseobacter sp. HKCCA0434]|uniref:hypothetical protein n=1 Tax=Roseobacter sp. HKCCA0434 TaxID=3079297 RepID=UPI0029057FD7|nr:hypothetical protein [Roseobacter sp. HKCCA0434]